MKKTGGHGLFDREDPKGPAVPEVFDAHSESHPTASERFTVPYEAVEYVWGAIPSRLRRKPHLLRSAIRDAIAMVRREMGDGVKATEHIAKQVQAYCESGETTDEYYREVLTWFRDGGYLEDPAAWRTRKQHAEKSKVEAYRRKHG